MRVKILLAALALSVLAAQGWAADEAQWHYESVMDVPAPGLTETVVPAGLLFVDEDSQALDLSLRGPDGNPRAFELYWRTDSQKESIPLTDFSVSIDKPSGLLWEAPLPQGFKVERVEMQLPSSSGIGSAVISARDSNGWHTLASGLALYADKDGLSAGIDIKPASYDRIRLSFKGYDNEMKETAFPVRVVTVTGRRADATGYIEADTPLAHEQSIINGITLIKTALPGRGLVINTLSITTSAWFQGTWSAGYERVVEGNTVYMEMASGIREGVGDGQARLDISIARQWPERTVVIKLDPKGKYIGKVTEVSAAVRLPRMRFPADMPGVYRLRTGFAGKAQVGELQASSSQSKARFVRLSKPVANDNWQPINLIESFAIEGGPFDAEGYRWKSRLDIAAPGYYRLYLNAQASLDRNPYSLRLVKETAQIPWFSGPGERKSIELPARSSYDKDKNTSRWSVSLPVRSSRWSALRLESEGIFSRTVIVSVAGEAGSPERVIGRFRWDSAEKGAAEFSIGLAGLPKDADEIEISISHGDNRPIDIKRVRVEYTAPAIMFIAKSAGEYYIYGGNEKASEPRYDLSMVRAHLSGHEPLEAVMQEPSEIKPSILSGSIREAFEDKHWGLYAVLGLVTLALVIIIVRLFPKEKA